MSNLIIVDGTSGIWKDDLVGYIIDTLVDSTLIVKKSTRGKRETDSRLDLQFVDQEEFNQYNCEYKYKYNGEFYGFLKIELENALLKYKNTFVIIRNIDVIKNICNDFRESNIIRVFIYTDAKIVARRMNIVNNSSINKSIKEALDDYLRNPEIYDLVLINGASKNDFCRLIDYAIMFVDKKGKKKKYFILTNSQKLVINIILPILDALISGLVINSITSNPLNQWNIICCGLSILHIIWLVIIQYMVNK